LIGKGKSTTLQLLDGWPTPAAPFCKKEATPTSPKAGPEECLSDPSTDVAGRFQSHAQRVLGKPSARRFLTSTHLAPSLVSRGGSAIQNIFDCVATSDSESESDN
jgi:hypothetical protein